MMTRSFDYSGLPFKSSLIMLRIVMCSGELSSARGEQPTRKRSLRLLSNCVNET